MKKLLLILALISWFCNVNSQILDIEIGPTISKIDWYTTMSTDITVFEDLYTGYYANLRITYFEKQYFELGSHIGYTNAGGKGSGLRVLSIDPEVLDTINTVTSLGLINLGSELKAKYRIGKFLVPFIQVGVELDYLATINENYGDILGQFGEWDELNRLLFYAEFGAGIFYSLNRLRIGLNYQYNLALNDIVNYKSDWGVTNVIGFNYSRIGISLGYWLN